MLQNPQKKNIFFFVFGAFMGNTVFELFFRVIQNSKEN